MKSHPLDAAACVLRGGRTRRSRRADRALALATLTSALFAASPAFANVFGPNIPWPATPIHMGMMPDGNVITFGAKANGDQGGFDLTLWNPRQGTGPNSRVVIPNAVNFDSFCVGGVLNPFDGQILLAGGRSNALVGQFDYATKRMSLNQSTRYPRYYATTTTLPDGRIHIVGGSPSYGNQGNSSNISEIYSPGRGWGELPGTGKGPQRRGDPQTTGNPMWYPHVYPVRNNEVFVVAGKYQYFENYSGAGAIRDEKLWTQPNFGASSAGLMFRPGLVMQLGGGGATNGDLTNRGSNLATIIDLRGVDAKGNTTVVKRDTQMQMARHWPTATLMANGEVLVSGGSAVNNTLDGVAYQTEIYNPDNGQWRMGAALSTPRLYHSAALLLKDGRVMVGGGGAPGPVWGNSVEIYTPDYLRNANGVRPSVLTGPSRVALGQAFQVTTDKPITRMTLVKTGVVTHGFNTDQRFFQAAFVKSGNGYSVTFPNDAINATPGMYMLFAFDSRGVPSEGKFLHLPGPKGDSGRTFPVDTPTSTQVPAIPVAPSLKPDTLVAFEPSTWPGYRIRHRNFQGYIDPINGASSAVDQAGSSWVVRKGLANPTCYSFESTDWPGYYLRHQNYRLIMNARDGSDVFNRGATYCARAARNGQGSGAVTLESIDQPGYFVHHKNFEMWIDADNGAGNFAGDVTFNLLPALVNGPVAPQR